MKDTTERHSKAKYTCNEYREEMILLALQHKLQQACSPEEKERIRMEIARLEEKMGL